MFEKLSWTELQTCVAARWAPVIGDPTATGWLTVLAYATCMVLAVLVWRGARKGGERWFWAVLALAMAALAVNKQLDLQSALTALGRCVSQVQGWYEERRAFQRQFILGLLAVIAVLSGLALFAMRNHLRRNGLALVGLGCVAGYVAVRAVGFHHFETLINARVMDLRFNFLFENSGLVLIALNAVALLTRGRQA